MHRKQEKGWVKHLDFVLLDLLCIFIAFAAAYWIWPNGLSAEAFLKKYRGLLVVVTISNLAAALIFGSFSGVLRRGFFREFTELARHTVLAAGMVAIYMFAARINGFYSGKVLATAAAGYFILAYVVRNGYKAWRRARIRSNTSVLLVTDSVHAEQLLQELRGAGTPMAEPVGIALVDCDSLGEIASVPVVANRETVTEYACRNWVDEVFICLPYDSPDLKRLQNDFLQMGITVHLDIAGLTDYAEIHPIVEKFGSTAVLTSGLRFVPTFQLILKRVMDIVGGLVGCLITLLLCLILGPIILINSPGPLFFKQERVGMNGKRFKMYKFRSMYPDAEERKKEYLAQNRVSDGMMFKLDWDPRIIGNKTLPDGTRKTGIGEFIRKTSLDEFPQFLNVLKGEMSLVGTRPPTVDEWERYELHHRARLATKPGITGMWQVSGRSEITDFEEVVRLDTQYIYNWNIGMDIKILLKTVLVVLRHDGAM